MTGAEGCRGGHEEQEVEEGASLLCSIAIRMTWLQCSAQENLGEQMVILVEDGKEHSVTETTTEESIFLIY